MIRLDDNFKKRKVVLEGIVTDKWFEMIDEIKSKQLEQKEVEVNKISFLRGKKYDWNN